MLSNNFQRTKPPAATVDESMDEDDTDMDVGMTSAADLNCNITGKIPLNILKEQELIQKRIMQEHDDMTVALKLHNKLNKEKCQTKRKHGYQLRSAKRK